MKRNIYALLVGISRFVLSDKIPPLKACGDDVKKMGKYLKTLESDSTKVHVKELIDSAATRKAIIDNFLEHGKKAGKDDIFLFYFSSHGVQERADRVFWQSSPDKKLESLICYDAFLNGTYPIADKELRYMLNEVYKKNHCEIVTLFDCCHSGDNTRSVELDKKVEVKMMDDPQSKELFTAQQRNWSKFLFSDKFTKDQFDGDGKVNTLLPQANHTSISACSAYEPAYIVENESLFTKHFLSVMTNARGDVSYYDLHSRIQARLHPKQTPRLYTWPNKGKQAFRSFLFGAAMDRPVVGNVFYLLDKNDKKKPGKWVIDLGGIHGVQPTSKSGRSIVVNLSNSETCKADIDEVFPGFSTLIMEPYANYSTTDLGGYTGSVGSLISKPVFISFKGEKEGIDKAKAYFDTNRNKMLQFNFFDVNKEGSIPLEIHANKGRYYLSRPKATVSLGSSFEGYTDDSLASIFENAKKVSTWQFSHDLQNDSPKVFNQDVIDIEITQDGNVVPLVDGAYSLKYNLDPVGEDVRTGGCMIKFTSKSLHKIELSCLYLSQKFGIITGLLQPKITTLEKGQSVTALDGNEVEFGLSKEEVDNKQKETVILLKVIYANSPYSIDMFDQEELRSAEEMAKGDLRIGGSKKKEVKPDWRTQLFKIVIPNPEI